ncbi:MAG: hypothetical protein HY905_05040 [Deltaproteobacteria bacterium]|nr:hypothetical protein [Deltaproteobacteria bacterium]
MTPQGLHRLRIADLVVELPADLELPDEAVLEANLRPFVAVSGPEEGAADIVVDCAAGPVDERELPQGAFRVDVNRVGATAADDPIVKTYWLWEGEGAEGGEDRLTAETLRTLRETLRKPGKKSEAPKIHVRGALKTALEVVAGIHLGLAHLLPKRDGLLLHASAVRAADSAFVFAGPAESGKSTAASGFSGGTVLADERVAVRAPSPQPPFRPEFAGSPFPVPCSPVSRPDPPPVPSIRSSWLAYPVPMWGGKYSPVVADVVPLAMVVVVRKGAPLAASVLPAAAGMSRLARAVVHNHYDGARADWVLGILARLATEVPVVELSYGLGESFADVLVGRLDAARRGEASC